MISEGEAVMEFQAKEDRDLGVEKVDTKKDHLSNDIYRVIAAMDISGADLLDRTHRSYSALLARADRLKTQIDRILLDSRR